MHLKKLFAFVLIAGFLLGTACRKSKKKEVTPISFSEYYSTDTQIFKCESFTRCCILDEYVCAQTYTESEEFKEAYFKYLYAMMEGEEYSPVDEEGNPLNPENILKFYDYSGTEISSCDMNEEFGRSLEERLFFSTGNEVWALSAIVDDVGRQTLRADKVDPQQGSVKDVECDTDVTKLSIRSFYVDSQDRICVTLGGVDVNTALYVFDKDGDLDIQIELPCNSCTNVVEWDEKLVIADTGVYEGDHPIYALNEKKTEWEELDRKIGSCTRLLVRDDKLFANSWKALTYVGEEANESLFWTRVSIFGTVDDVKLGNNDEIFVLSQMASGDMMVLYHLTPSQKDPDTEKKEIVIAGSGLQSTMIPTLVEELSLKNPDVKYVLRDYCDDFEVPEDGEGEWRPSRQEVFEQMSLDLVSGNAPDLYYDPYNSLELDELSRLGYLTDLSPYVDEMDPEAYYIDQLKIGKETPYVVSCEFSVMGFEASPKYVKNPEVWSYEDFYESAKSFPDLQSLQQYYTKEDLLYDALLSDMDRFMENGQLNFNSEEYIKLLEWANDVGHGDDWFSSSQIDLDNGVFMLDWGGISNLRNVIWLGDHILVGWPEENGSLHCLSRDIFAVSSTCKNPDLAWEVISYAIGDEFMTRHESMFIDIPVNKEMFHKGCDKIYDMEKESSSYMSLNRSREEYTQTFEEIIARADHYETGSRIIADICVEEALEYFYGDYSAEHVAELTQHRALTYIQETS